jgi:ABC-2 type transport system permease protein
MRETAVFLRLSWRMMRRARGTLYLMAATPLLVVVIAAMRRLSYATGGHQMSFVDFVVPGMAAFAATHLLQDTMVAVAASYRARGVLRRLAVTPVSAARLIGVQIGTYLLLGVAASTGLLLVGAAAGAHIAFTARLAWLLPLFVMLVATGLAFAFAIAGAFRTPEAANAFSVLTGLPLGFLIGTTYPRGALPGALPQLTGYLPYAPTVQAVRGIALGQAPITHYGPQLLIGLGWLLLALTLAVRLYRLTED